MLKEGGYTLDDVSVISFYDKPFIKFERLLETYLSYAPKGLLNFLSGIPVWIKEKLFMKKMLWDELGKIGPARPELIFPEHHLSHAASAFYPSPYNESAVLTVDGVGEWATATIGYGNGNTLEIIKELHFPHSVGLLYSAFTYFCGFKVNSGEYKLMGLAPYGDPGSKQKDDFKSLIYKHVINLLDDGSLFLNMEYFNFATGLTMIHHKKWESLFGLKKRESESPIDQSYMNMALAIQEVTEDIILKLARTAKKLTSSKNCVLSGGVALNCVANGKLLREKIFDNVWIQPAAGDAGGALGAAYCAHYILNNNHRKIEDPTKDSMAGAYLGPGYTNKNVLNLIRKYDLPYSHKENFDDLCMDVATKISNGNVIGWFQGRMEYGPRALGNRSILGDPRDPAMQKKLNLKIKYREGFRPFAPSVLEEDIEKYFDLKDISPYMLLVAPVQKNICNDLPENYNRLDLLQRLYFIRSNIPAITHIDFSARIQSVNKNTNYRYWNLINTFKNITSIGLVVNTSFNVRGEPIVCTPEDAYRCFMRTEMDYLVINDYLFSKKEQPKWNQNDNWKDEFVLD